MTLWCRLLALHGVQGVVLHATTELWSHMQSIDSIMSM
jgi:hypothetical protein